MHDKPVSFDARHYHMVEPHEGSMWALAAYVPQAFARATEQHRQALRETEVTDSVDRFGRSGISGGGRNPTLRAVTDPSRSFHELLQFLTLCQKMTHLGGEKFLTKTLAEVNFTPK